MNDRPQEALIALRRIQRKTEEAAKQLASKVGLTPSQLRVLQILNERGETSVGDISRLTQLKHATITTLIDKLEASQLVSRRRCNEDRRRVWLSLLPRGVETLHSAPDMLQDTFQSRFVDLPDWHQTLLVATLEHIASLLDAEALDAAPFLDIGDLDQRPPT